MTWNKIQWLIVLMIKLAETQQTKQPPKHRKMDDSPSAPKTLNNTCILSE